MYWDYRLYFYFYIKQPLANSTGHLSWENSYPISVQVICDYNYRFLDSTVKWPGSIHDARIVLTLSCI